MGNFTTGVRRGLLAGLLGHLHKGTGEEQVPRQRPGMLRSFRCQQLAVQHSPHNTRVRHKTLHIACVSATVISASGDASAPDRRVLALAAWTTRSRCTCAKPLVLRKAVAPRRNEPMLPVICQPSSYATWLAYIWDRLYNPRTRQSSLHVAKHL
jgi:hypothetical protein